MSPGYRDIYQRTPHAFPVINGSGASILLSDAFGVVEAGQRVLVTNLILSASAAGTIIFRSNTDELWRYTFPTGELTLTLTYNPDGWGPLTTHGESLRLDNSTDSLTLTGCGNFIYL